MAILGFLIQKIWPIEAFNYLGHFIKHILYLLFLKSDYLNSTYPT